MSKVIPIALETHYQGATTSTAYILKVTRTDSVVFAFTSHKEDQTVGGQLYSSGQGLTISNLVQNSGLATDNMELTTVNDGSLFTDLDIRNGIWRNAVFILSRYNWKSPSDGSEPLIAGTFGEVVSKNNYVMCELRGLQQYLQQPVGSLTSKTCRARLGDGLCRKVLTSFTHAGTVTSLVGPQVFTDSALVQADDYFGAGEVRWLTGANSGLKARVKLFSAGQVTLTLPMLSGIAIGDTFTAIAGCRLRFEQDCKAKFSNGINFQGEPHVPGIDKLTQSV
jgi:uncharacterized phage protein (TIGR02218 family)